MQKIIRVGTRSSALALTQTKQLISEMKSLNSNLDFQIVSITTSGDKDQEINFSENSDVGWFTKELEKALLEKEIDIAIHSLKDVPTQQPEGLCLAIFPKRNFPEDILLFKNQSAKEHWQNITHNFQKSHDKKPSQSPSDLSSHFPSHFASFVIGTSSPRREMLFEKYSDFGVTTSPIRGNIDTRIKKLRQLDSDYSAIVLARAGLTRMSIDDPLCAVLDKEQFTPAPGQGCLVVQCRTQDNDIIQQLKNAHDQNTYYAVDSERYFMQILEAGCKTPLGAYASVSGEEIVLKTKFKRGEKVLVYDFVTTVEGYKEGIRALLHK